MLEGGRSLDNRGGVGVTDGQLAVRMAGCLRS